MSSTELDLPLLPSAEQIRRREFATIRRGYDHDQVRDYLQQIAAQVETLEGELREARLVPPLDGESSGVPEPAEDPYEKLAARFADLLRSAETEAAKIVEEARAEAARAIGEARSEADRIRVDAQARAEEARQAGQESLRDAKREAERMLSGLSARRETLVEQLHHMQDKLLGVARELETAIDGSGAPATENADPPAAEAGSDTTEPDPQKEVPDTDFESLWVATETISMDLEELDPGPEDEPGS